MDENGIKEPGTEAYSPQSPDGAIALGVLSTHRVRSYWR